MSETNRMSLKWVLAGAILAGAFALLLAGGASAVQSGSQYSGSGNWDVTTPTQVQDETVDVSGTITVSSTFDLRNVVIRFTVPNGGIVIVAPSGGMTLNPGSGTNALITTSNTNYYWSFTIANTTSDVIIQNATLDQVNNGVTITGGTAASRYFAFVTVTHAKGYGFRLTDSWATLLKVNVTLDFVPVVIRVQNQACGSNQSFNYTSGSLYYGYTYTYRCIYDYWSAAGTGVSVLRGGPWVDGIEVHVPALNQRIDVDLEGGLTGYFNFSYYYNYVGSPCYGLQRQHYWYYYNYTYHQFYPFLSFNGTIAQDASFAYYNDVRPPPEDLFVDFHYDLTGQYAYNYEYCGYTANQAYSYPDYVYSFNQIRWYTADIIGVKVINGGIGNNFNGLQMSMGKSGILITSDWGGSATYQQAFLTSYATFPTPNLYAFWSSESVNISAAQALTRTDFTIRNSVASGAGMRFDRIYSYTAASLPAGAADTTFRGIVTLDNITISNVVGLGLDIRIIASATATPNKFDYTASVTNSYFSATRALSLSVPNLHQATSNYTGSFLFEGNTFRDGNVTPPSSIPSTGYTYTPITSNTFRADLYLDTGWHASTLGGDWYKVDVTVRNNVFQNLSGTVFAWPYSDYVFGGGSTLTFTNNTFRQISHWQRPLPGGGMSAPMQGDEMIKTVADSVSFVGNTFDDISMTFGIVGAWIGPNPLYPYYPFSLCSFYMANYGYNYWFYGCSWPSKTPTIVVESNTFNGVRSPQGAPRDSAFFALPGHAKLTFNNNTITASSAVFVNAFLYFYITNYQFPVADIDARIQGNTIRGQTANPPFIYEDPFKAGNPIKLLDNDYRDSSAPLFKWMWTYYPSLSVSYRPAENLATMIVAGNFIKNVTSVTDAVLGLTGRATIVNNTFEDVNGWAITVSYMTKVPAFSDTNRLINVTNGYWIAPINTGGTLQTATLTNLTILVTGTAIRWENGNLILINANFGNAVTPIHMVNGHADIYSSNIPVLSATVSAGGSVSVYNTVGFKVSWADAAGVDSGIEVANAALVTSSSEHKILSSGRADAQGIVAPRLLLIWEEFSFGATYEGHVYAPFEILVSAQGVSEIVKLPDLGPGEVPTNFQDYPDYPVLLRDTMVPVISIGTPTPGSTLGTLTVPVEGHSFERGSGLAVERVRLDSGAWLDIDSDTATWQITMTAVGEGLHTLYGEVRDRAGNVYMTQVSFFIDITPPSLEITDPLEEYTNTRDSTYIVQGHVEPISSLVDINGISVPVLGRGEFAIEFPMLDGLNVLFITAEDAAGNELTVVRSIYFDQYSPFIQVSSPVDGLLTSVSVIDVTGRAEPGATVTVNGAPVVASPLDGSFVLPNFVLADLYDQTENLLVIRAQDAVGNSAYDNRTVIVDIRAPAITLELDPAVAARLALGLPVSATSIDVRGKTDSADAEVTIAGQDIPLSGLSFSRVIVLAEGRNTIEVTAMDNVGNERTVTLVVVRDTTKPSLTIDRPAELTVLTNQRTLEIRGTTDSAGATVYLEYTNAAGAPVQDALPAAAVGLPVQYRFEREIDLVTDGNKHEVLVRVVDAAGNEATEVVTYTSKVTLPYVVLLNMPERTTETFVWVNGSTDEGISKVRINGQTFDVEARYFSVRWNLPVTSGDYTFRVTVVDQAGNVGLTTATLAVEIPQAPGGVSTARAGVSSELLAGGAIGLLGVALAVLFVGWTRRKGEP